MSQLKVGKVKKGAVTYADPSGGSVVADCYSFVLTDEHGAVGTISLFDRSKAIAAREAIAWAIGESDWKRR